MTEYPTDEERLAARYLIEHQRDPTLIQLLDAVVYALSVIPNTRLLAAPLNVKNTYALVKLVEEELKFRKEHTDAH